MRLIALLFAAFLACGPAAAQSWKDYDYPDLAFGLAFPAEPKVETSTYLAADGTNVDARVYLVEQDNVVYKMTVADLSKTAIGEKTAIDYAVKKMAENGTVTVNIGHRVNRVFGRQLAIANKDGGHSSSAVFYNQKRLYQIEGTVLPTHPDPASGEAIRFQQSLRFTGRFLNLGRLFGPRSPR